MFLAGWASQGAAVILVTEPFAGGGGEVAVVSAIRQVSIPLSVLLGALVLNEKRFLVRLAWSLLLAGGVVIIILGG